MSRINNESEWASLRHLYEIYRFENKRMMEEWECTDKSSPRWQELGTEIAENIKALDSIMTSIEEYVKCGMPRTERYINPHEAAMIAKFMYDPVLGSKGNVLLVQEMQCLLFFALDTIQSMDQEAFNNAVDTKGKIKSS